MPTRIPVANKNIVKAVRWEFIFSIYIPMQTLPFGIGKQKVFLNDYSVVNFTFQILLLLLPLGYSVEVSSQHPSLK